MQRDFHHGLLGSVTVLLFGVPAIVFGLLLASSSSNRPDEVCRVR